MCHWSDIDVTAIGELLIDFTPNGKGEAGNPAFEINPGGAPVNCLATLARLGAKTEFIGKIGDDSFGRFLKNVLLSESIGVEGLSVTEKIHTTMAFVYIDNYGERSFSFLRNPGADTQLERNDFNLSLIDRSRIIHFGSLSFTDNPARDALQYALEYAKKTGKIISYDPNYRPLLWHDEETALCWLRKGLKYADIAKMSEEEMILITGQTDLQKGALAVRKMGPQHVFITLGSKGAFYYANDHDHSVVPSFNVNAIDTTGCGDAFMGAVLYQILHEKDRSFYDIVRYANAVGALCATRKGGLPAMPESADVERVMDKS